MAVENNQNNAVKMVENPFKQIIKAVVNSANQVANAQPLNYNFSQNEIRPVVTESDNEQVLSYIQNSYTELMNEENDSYLANRKTKKVSSRKPSSGSKDGQIDTTQQQKNGDCWLLSAVNSLSYTEKGKEIIQNCLEYQDGETVVHLATGDVVITDEQLAQAKSSNAYSAGDDDMIIFELAIQQVREDIAHGAIEFKGNVPEYLKEKSDFGSTKDGSSVLYGGWPLEALYYITGIDGSHASTKSGMKKMLDNFDRNNGENIVLSAGILQKDLNGDGQNDSSVTVKDINGENVELATLHAYAIKNVENGIVTLTNPWDSSKDIVLDENTFLNTFGALEEVNLNEEPAEFPLEFHDVPYERKETINGQEYIINFDYDKNGNFISKTIRLIESTIAIKYTLDEEGNLVANLAEIDKDGNIKVTEDKFNLKEADKIVSRGLLNTTKNVQETLKEIIESQVCNLTNIQWKKIEEFITFDKARSDLSDLVKIANLTDSDITLAFKMFSENPQMSLAEIYETIKNQ